MLGLGYLAAFLKKEGYEVRILDCIPDSDYKVKIGHNFIRYGFSDELILRRIAEYNPDVVGVTCTYTSYLKDAHNVAKLCKHFKKTMPVIFGGAHTSTFPKEVLKDENVDCVVIGEGELTLLEIVKRIERKEDLTGIPGTAYRVNGKVNLEKLRELIKNLDELPFPAWHLLDKEAIMKEVSKSPYIMRKPNGSMITSRGCPMNCYFCSVRKTWGRTWRGRSPKNVVDEMEFLKSIGFREIHFIDDNCSISRKRLEEICKEIIRRKLDVKWTTPTGIAIWTLDEKLLDIMKRSGCYRLTFGIESGDEKTRKIIRKAGSLSHAKRVITYANKIGMWTAATFIIGFPHETRKEIEKTISVAKWLNLDLAIFYLLIPQPGADVYEIFKQQGLLNLDQYLDPNNPDENAQLGRIYCSGVATKNFTKLELQELLNYAYKSFYRHKFLSLIKNPSQIIRKIHSFEDLKYLSTLTMTVLTMLVNFLTQRQFSNISIHKRQEKKVLSQA
jgi:magnesium-protoporphyrin IX monomethyl ester (oxidative) cyclase